MKAIHRTHHITYALVPPILDTLPHSYARICHTKIPVKVCNDN